MESLIPNNFCFPKRAGLNSVGRPIEISTNYYPFIPSGKNSYAQHKQFHKYAIIIEPDIPGDSVKLRYKIWRLAKPKINECLNITIYNNNTCYSRVNYTNEILTEVQLDGVDYQVKVKWTNLVEEKSLEALGLYKKFFINMVNNLNLIRIRRSYFKRNYAQQIEGVEVWGGFNPTVNLLSMGILLNINMIHRVLRPDTALENLRKLMQSNIPLEETQNEIRSAFRFSIMLTRYNNDKTYTVEDVDFSKTPLDTFSTKEGPISFKDYYQKKYNINVKDNRQPLFACKDRKSGGFIYLIPELCYMTGLTDEMRGNFNLMKKLAELTSGNPAEKARECQSLIKAFFDNQKCKQDMEDWGLAISNEPIKIMGRKLAAGNYLLSSGNDQFDIDCTDDIDRRIQNEMFTQPKLSRWIVIYNDNFNFR